MLKELALAVGKNLYEKLSMTYPDGNFRLYVEINVKEGITLRFHQVWAGEKPIYSDEMIAESQSNREFQVHRRPKRRKSKGLRREKRKEHVVP